MGGGVCTMESSRPITTKIARPEATIISDTPPDFRKAIEQPIENCGFCWGFLRTTYARLRQNWRTPVSGVSKLGYSGLQAPTFTAKAASEIHRCPWRCSNWKLLVGPSARTRQSEFGVSGARLMAIGFDVGLADVPGSPPSLRLDRVRSGLRRCRRRDRSPASRSSCPRRRTAGWNRNGSR